MFPDIVGFKIFLEHLHHLIRQRMGRTQDHIRLLRLHILRVHCEKFLVRPGIDIFPAGQLHQTSHIRIFRGDDIRTGKSHQHQHFGRFFPFIFTLILFIKLRELIYQLLRLRLPVKNLSQFLNRTVHPLHAAQIQKSPVRIDGFIFGLLIRLQGGRA